MAQISLRIDDDVKKGAEETFNEIGLSMSAAINIFLKKVDREKRMPFEIRLDEPNAVTYAAMEASEKDEDMYGPFESVHDLMKALNA